MAEIRRSYYDHSRRFIEKLVPEDDPEWMAMQRTVATLVRELALDQVDEEMLLEMLGLEPAA